MKFTLIAFLVLVLTSCASGPVKGEVVGKKYHPARKSVVSVKPIIFQNKPEKWTLDIQVKPGDIEEVTVTKGIFDQADVGERYDESTGKLSP